jgi:hypothetical protein
VTTTQIIVCTRHYYVVGIKRHGYFDTARVDNDDKDENKGVGDDATIACLADTATVMAERVMGNDRTNIMDGLVGVLGGVRRSGSHVMRIQIEQRGLMHHVALKCCQTMS